MVNKRLIKSITTQFKCKYIFFKTGYLYLNIPKLHNTYHLIIIDIFSGTYNEYYNYDCGLLYRFSFNDLIDKVNKI